MIGKTSYGLRQFARVLARLLKGPDEATRRNLTGDRIGNFAREHGILSQKVTFLLEASFDEALPGP